jgi:DNA repair exonuclease SbcCD ATPase subunit
MENFLPFRDRVELPLADQGLVLVKGRNLVSEALDSNGVGKTSIPHGISWCLFGEDLSGRRADAVACRFTDGACVVSMDMEDEVGPWSVTRTRRPAGLSVTGIAGIGANEDMSSVQRKIEQRLGFGVRTFKNAVVFGQGTFERFAGADQAEQMRMLDEIQGVDFREALARAKAWRDDLQEKHRQASSAVDSARELYAAAAKTVTDMRRARDAYEVERRRWLAKIAEDALAVEQRLLAARADARQAEADARSLSALREEERRERALDAERSALRVALDEAKVEEDVAKNEETNLAERLDELVRSGACPACRRTTVKSQEKVIRKLFEPELAKLRAARVKAEHAVDRAAAVLDEAVKRHAAQLLTFQRLVPDEYAAQPGRYVMVLEERCGARAASLRADRERSALAEARRLEADRARAEAQWSGQGSLDEAEAMAVAHQEAGRLAAQKADRIAAAVKIAEYWYEAFGDRGIRSMLVDGVADFINQRIARHLEVLACGEASVRMSAQTDLKRGGTRERISFNPEWAWGGVGAGTGSGGQDRRVDLAVFAAVQDLSETRSARPFPLKIFDEPFDALDSRGKELAGQWVKSIAKKHGTGLLITHSEEMAVAADPDSVWEVIMDKDGAHVVVA